MCELGVINSQEFILYKKTRMGAMATACLLGVGLTTCFVVVVVVKVCFMV